jgi:microcystin degradation protein MlrC
MQKLHHQLMPVAFITFKMAVTLNSMQHFRAAFEPIAEKIIVCHCGALCTTNGGKLLYQKLPRPSYPPDPEMAL